MNDGAIWFRCKGCGEPAGYYPDGLTSQGRSIPPGAVVHSRPITQSAPVQCALFRRSDPRQFWELHKDAERVPVPVLTPMHS